MTATPYYTAADLREATVLDRMDRFSDSLLEDLVAEYEELVERECGVAFTTREATVVVPVGHHSSHRLDLPGYVKVTAVSAISIDGYDFTDADLAAVTLWGDEGALERPWAWCGIQAIIDIEHGETTPPPAVLRGCREFVRAKATKGAGNAPRDAGGPAGVDGTTYPTASTKPTGLREVDRIIATLPHYRIPVVG